MWTVKIHRLVIEEDFKKIDRPAREEILRTIYKKLTLDPEKYGAPLRHELKGYWKLKISDYRVIYRVEKDIVRVLFLKVGFRKDSEVYEEMFSRLKKI